MENKLSDGAMPTTFHSSLRSSPRAEHGEVPTKDNISRMQCICF